MTEELNENLELQETEGQEQVDTQEPTVTVAELQRRLDKQQQKFDQQLKDAIEKERSYAEMSEKEKKDAQLTEREQELAEREAAIAKLELQAEVKADVQDKGLPLELVDLLTQSDDKEQILESVNAIKKLLDEAVTEGIKANARQSAPTEPTREYGGENLGASMAEFANQQRIIQN